MFSGRKTCGRKSRIWSLDCCSVVQIKIKFAFYLEITVAESGGREERLVKSRVNFPQSDQWGAVSSAGSGPLGFWFTTV